MYHYSKTFFSGKRANAFAEELEKQGAEDITISSARDAFGQTQHRVCWNF